MSNESHDQVSAEYEGDPLAPFRPRRSRRAAAIMGWAAVLLFGVLALLIPTVAGGANWGIVDRLMFFFIGLAIGALAYRYATIEAIPSRDGLHVRNLIISRDLAWEEILGVQFGGGDPWPNLDMSDGDTLGIMAIQKADAEYGRSEASRLAALVMAFGEAREGTTKDGE